VRAHTHKGFFCLKVNITRPAAVNCRDKTRGWEGGL